MEMTAKKKSVNKDSKDSQQRIELNIRKAFGKTEQEKRGKTEINSILK